MEEVIAIQPEFEEVVEVTLEEDVVEVDFDDIESEVAEVETVKVSN